MNESLSLQTLSLWAKTGDDQTWLSLHQHMRDAADVAGYLYDAWLPLSTQRFLAHQIGLGHEEMRAIVTWLAGSHDIGKATKPFQFQISQSAEHGWLARNVREAGFSPALFNAIGVEVEKLPHSVYSQAIQQWWLQQERGWSPISATQLASIGGAHHGIPPTSSQIGLLRQQKLLTTHEAPWQHSWCELLEYITAYTNSDSVLREHPRLKIPVHAQMVLTGLVIMSDWIASNSDLFPLSGPHNPISNPQPNERLDAAMNQLQLPPPWRPSRHVRDVPDLYRQRFNWPDHFTPNQLQLDAAEIGQTASEPGLFIIEAPMGMGKTEAGLILADLIAGQLDLGGLIFATPTTATSDGLFGRTVTWAENTQQSKKLTSMFLAHSRNTLSDNFMAMRRQSRFLRQPEAESQHSQAISHDWLFGRKKGILADIVIGTVDQVLQMALQTKHVMLKHLSFAGKIVLIDEVHSYDAYMQTYLHRAVQWLASYGASVILLSATLPQHVRGRLAHSYQEGLGVRPDTWDATAKLDLSYPVITQVNSAGVMRHLVPDDAAPKSIRLCEIDDSIETVLTKLEPLHIDGGCAVVICNSV